MTHRDNPFDEPVSTNPTGATAIASSSRSRASLSGRSEEIFRGMWASLFYSGRVTGKTLLVTSSDRREGATTTACGLALSGSGPAGGAKVALVDFNLRSPDIHNVLKLRQSPGIAEIFAKSAPIETAAQPVNPNLDVYTAGAIAQQSLNVLKSDIVGKFFNFLAKRYDYVIVDCASANHFPDAQVLGSVLKEVVMVIHSDQTPREAVAQAKKRIESGGGKVAGLVLNMRTFPIPNFLYRRV